MPSRLKEAAVGLAVGGLAAVLAQELSLAILVSYWDDVVPAIAPCAVVASVLWLTRLRVVIAAGTALLAILWLAVVYTPLCPALAAGLVRRDLPADADAVVVLSSRIQRDGDLTASSMSRLVHGLELLGAGRAPRLILTETHSVPGSYAEPARRMMERLGLRRELIVLGPVGNTRDEALLAGKRCREAGWRRILLVTSPVHTRRAAAVFAREGVDVVSSPCVETNYDVEGLGEARDRLDAFGAVAHERIGLWLYRRRGWID